LSLLIGRCFVPPTGGKGGTRKKKRLRYTQRREISNRRLASIRKLGKYLGQVQFEASKKTIMGFSIGERNRRDTPSPRREGGRLFHKSCLTKRNEGEFDGRGEVPSRSQCHQRKLERQGKKNAERGGRKGMID